MTAWSSPSTIASGDLSSASQWNTYLRDNELYLKEQLDALAASGVQISKVGQTIPDDTDTTINFNSEDFDAGGWFPGSGTTITAPAGAFPTGVTDINTHVVAVLSWAANATGYRRARILLNGSSCASDSSALATAVITHDKTLSTIVPGISVGDTFALEVRQNSGGNLAVSVVFSVFRFAAV